MTISWNDYNSAESFVGMQHWGTVNTIGTLPGVNASAVNLLKGPGIIINVPYPNKGTDFTDSICLLFHEWGHQLDALRSFGDAENHTELQSRCTSYFDEKVSLLPEKGRERLVHENAAWDLGLNGFIIGNHPYKGLKAFLDETFDSQKAAAALNRYGIVRDIGLQSYTET